VLPGLGLRVEIFLKLDLMKASRRLSELDLKVTSDNLLLEILWFRLMSMGADQVINRHTHSTYEFHFIASGSVFEPQMHYYSAFAW
jgi:hypothetical protein